MSDIELRVVCRECGSEVSPYVTECPYCGARVRKRAPELEHHDDHFEPKVPARRRLWSRLARRKGRGGGGGGGVATLTATGGGLAAPGLHLLAAATLLVVGVAGGWSLREIGAVAGPLDGEWWRLFSAQFAYDNVGYLLAVAIPLAIFGPGVAARLGAPLTLAFLIAAGVVGAGIGYLVAIELTDSTPLIAGGNGVALATVACWLALRRLALGGERPDMIGVGVVAVALLLLSALVDSADIFAALGGAVFGGLFGLVVVGVKRK